MKYTKECVTGNNINLSKYNLGIIKQPTVDKFMDFNEIVKVIDGIELLDINSKKKIMDEIEHIELIDFIKPFWMCLNLDNQDEVRVNKMHFSCYLMISGNEPKLIDSLLICLKVLYRTIDVDIYEFEDGYKLIVKKNGVSIAFIDDSNFIDLCECIVEICHFDKPKPEKKVEGDSELVKIAKEMEMKHNKKKKDTLEFEETVRQVMHYRTLNYDELKNWTIWYFKDVFMVQIFKEIEDRQYLLSTNSNVKIDLKKIKNWKDETKLTR